MSFAQEIKNLIHKNGSRVTYNGEIYDLANSLEHGPDNSKRRLRELTQKDHRNYTPEITPVYKGNAIIGYRWALNVGKDYFEGTKYKFKIDVSNTPKLCCPSWQFYQIHSQDCPVVKKKEINTLF